jgi:hypothetical protein
LGLDFTPLLKYKLQQETRNMSAAKHMYSPKYLRAVVLVLATMVVALPSALHAQRVANDGSVVGPIATCDPTGPVVAPPGEGAPAPVAPAGNNCGDYALTPMQDGTAAAAANRLLIPNCVAAPGVLCRTQLAARVYRPQVLGARRYPLIVFLHGNHGTCGRPYNAATDPPGLNPGGGALRIDDNKQFTNNGTCPANYTVVPSHLGYAYLANRLASWGYIVVSIDADYGVNLGADGAAGWGGAADPALIRARGRLVLLHLQQLARWDSGADATPASIGVNLQGRLDFTEVGLMGHSRGGEGVRSAYNLYTVGDPTLPAPAWPDRISSAVTFSAVFEIAPTDAGADGAKYNSFDVPWNVLLPMCDRDLGDLQGIRPFDRMMRVNDTTPAQKSNYLAWSTNHNFYNTQWMVSDTVIFFEPPAVPAPLFVTLPCIGGGNPELYPVSPGSATQRLDALSSVVAFFRANVGNTVPNAFDDTLNTNFNTLYSLPINVTDENPAANNAGCTAAAQPFACCTGAGVGTCPMISYPPGRIDRGYSPSRNLVQIVDDFERAGGMSSSGAGTTEAGALAAPPAAPMPLPANPAFPPVPHAPVPNHDPGQRDNTLAGSRIPATCPLPAVPPAGAVIGQCAGLISWTATTAVFQSNLVNPPVVGMNVIAAGGETLDLRISRQNNPGAGPAGNGADTTATDFSVRLVPSGGFPPTGSLPISNYAQTTVAGPVGGDGMLHPIMQTVRIPLVDFPRFAAVGVRLRGVQLLFNRTTMGSVYVSNIRISNTVGVGAAPLTASLSASTQAAQSAQPVQSAGATTTTPLVHPQSNNTVVSIAPSSYGEDITLSSTDGFPFRNQTLVLQIGTDPSGNPLLFTGGRYAGTSNTTIIFGLTTSQFAQLVTGAPMTVQYGTDPASEIWDFGTFNP